MKVDGRSIIITDPCYIAKDEHWGEEFNYDDLTISETLGFSDYLVEDTGYGDGTWSVFMTGKREPLNRLTSIIEDSYQHEDISEVTIGDEIGKYSADAGMSCVLFLDEVEKYGPEDDLDILIERGCAVVIKNFVGDVEPYYDSEETLHFIGIGNKSFYTI